MAAGVLLSMGMGVDSAALLLRWLREPASRSFDLADLVVITAMTGDEYARTGQLMQDHLLPAMRAHRVRYVQVARAGQSDRDGYVVLDDSTSPQRMHMRGPWRLHDELSRTGTVPQVVTGRRLCSYRAKGQVLDWWTADHMPAAYRHAVGFAAEETRRAERDSSYTTTARDPWYPLIEWGWDRARCLKYLRETLGVQWQRSCCGYCPFQAGPDSDLLAARWAADPAAAVQALRLETVATALNPRSALFGTRSAASFAHRHGLGALVDEATAAIGAEPWSLYLVRRVFTARRGNPTGKGPSWRSVQAIDHGTADDVRAALRATPGTAADQDGHLRAWVRRAGRTFPTVEEFYVAAPAGVADKRRPGFAALWERTVRQLAEPRPGQLSLWDDLLAELGG